MPSSVPMFSRKWRPNKFITLAFGAVRGAIAEFEEQAVAAASLERHAHMKQR